MSATSVEESANEQPSSTRKLGSFAALLEDESIVSAKYKPSIAVVDGKYHKYRLFNLLAKDDKPTLISPTGDVDREMYVAFSALATEIHQIPRTMSYVREGEKEETIIKMWDIEHAPEIFKPNEKEKIQASIPIVKQNGTGDDEHKCTENDVPKNTDSEKEPSKAARKIKLPNTQEEVDNINRGVGCETVDLNVYENGFVIDFFTRHLLQDCDIQFILDQSNKHIIKHVFVIDHAYLKSNPEEREALTERRKERIMRANEVMEQQDKEKQDFIDKNSK